MRILIVDDFAPFRRLLADFLRSHPGIELVGEAANGEEALEQTDRLRPDLVLMDVSMPVVGGYDATRAIKERHPGTRVVILSSHSGEAYRSAARESRADGFIEKATMKSGLSLLLEGTGGSRVRMAI